MATYSHRCAACDTESPRSTDYQDAVDAQTFHRDQVHGGHIPRQGDTVRVHPTGWSDGDTTDRWIIVGTIIAMIIVAIKIF